MKTYEAALNLVRCQLLRPKSVSHQERPLSKTWAFVELAESSQKLFKTNGMPIVPRSQEHSQYGLNTPVKVLASQPSTGVTTGIRNGVLTTCSSAKEDMMRFDSQRDQAEMQPAYMEEFIIFGKRAHARQHEKGEFRGLHYSALS
ncbi:hypothetical protein FQN53_006518 [Emmonsiellopsis sp. PD_33]|nr:hypothetical protein FQN53_006518 [Emmonsiellopsis sp. PD_33]